MYDKIKNMVLLYFAFFCFGVLVGLVPGFFLSSVPYVTAVWCACSSCYFLLLLLSVFLFSPSPVHVACPPSLFAALMTD